MNNETKAQTYEIRIPVYASAPIVTNPKGFSDVTYGDMMAFIIKKIDEHNAVQKKIVSQQRKKTKQKEISNITYVHQSFNDTPALFVKMNAAITNLYDTYIERDELIELGKKDKVGSENNWLLLYPQIKGTDPNHYICYWLIFVYADPHKEFNDITQSAKMFVRNILELKLKNIKTKDVLTELKKIGSTPELKVRFTYVALDGGDVEVKYQNYVVGGSFKKEKIARFVNMPFDCSEELISDESYKQEYQKKEIFVGIGKKEYKIVKQGQLDDAKKRIEDAVEEMFNMSSPLAKEEIEPETLYNINFMTEKLKPVIENYLESYA
jgi:hypothetical protein